MATACEPSTSAILPRAGGYRLVTRSDMDGLVCAVLLKELDLLGEIAFVHPKDVQDGKVEITDRDILTNLPYVAECHLCIDHHASEKLRASDTPAANHVLSPHAPSAARVLYDFLGGREKLPNISSEMLAAVDKADSAQFTREDVLNAQGWELLSFLMDPRTGLGRFREFRVSNYQLMMQLIDCCQRYTISEILALPDVQERVELYWAHQQLSQDQIKRCTTVHSNVAVLDLRQEETIYAGNRFLIYALFPKCNVSIHVLWGLKKQNTVLAVGKSIFDRSSASDVGALMLKYGGGGHSAAGTCQLAHEEAEGVLREVIEQLNSRRSR